MIRDSRTITLATHTRCRFVGRILDGRSSLSPSLSLCYHHLPTLPFSAPVLALILCWHFSVLTNATARIAGDQACTSSLSSYIHSTASFFVLFLNRHSHHHSHPPQHAHSRSALVSAAPRSLASEALASAISTRSFYALVSSTPHQLFSALLTA